MYNLVHHRGRFRNLVQGVYVEKPPPDMVINRNPRSPELLNKVICIWVHNLTGTNIQVDIPQLVQVPIQGTDPEVTVVNVSCP